MNEQELLDRYLDRAREAYSSSAFAESAQEILERSNEFRHYIAAPVQQRTYRLGDIPTYATAISTDGLINVIKGSPRLNTLAGAGLVAVGRGEDILDGLVARLCKEESDTGALIDAAFDKVGIGFMVGYAWKLDVVPKPVLGRMVATNALNAGLTGVAALQNPTTSYRTPQVAKIGMASDNLSFFGYAFAHGFEREHPDLHFHEPLRQIARTAFQAGTVLAVPSAGIYASRIKWPLERK